MDEHTHPALRHRRCWADELPDACQTLLDPTIQYVDESGNPRVGLTDIPAGWVPLINALHRDIAAIEPDYTVVTAGQKAHGLRYQIVGPVEPQVRELIAAATVASESVCTTCGVSCEPANPPRCDRHPRRGTPFVFARPPRACAERLAALGERLRVQMPEGVDLDDIDWKTMNTTKCPPRPDSARLRKRT